MKADELNLILCIPYEGKRKPTPMLPSKLLPLQFFNAFVKLRNNVIFSSCSYLVYGVLISVRCFSCIYWCDGCWTFHSVMIALAVSRDGNRASSITPSTLVLNYLPFWACLNSYCLPRINPSSYDIWCLLYPSWFILKMLYWRQFSEHTCLLQNINKWNPFICAYVSQKLKVAWNFIIS